ncbi:DUF5316 domain-containing protein [Metabacillus sp. GX 13764]|uniref:DUF5316 domain-containing protein n=1 Tax=Metabacillus kandeliae TaxID=2900151 RepID=UPI001E63916E|nr:DUF5316 domain-containing protein [Metabacillus kandeliae]MCD7034797.1 DUF5316 domain-containing protein [Metabacillus kandeliae]
MKAFLIGVGLAILAVLASLLFGPGQLQSYLFITGAVLIGLSVIISGAAVSGDRMRANHYSETTADRRQRFSWSVKLLLAGVPSLAGAVLLHYFG